MASRVISSLATLAIVAAMAAPALAQSSRHGGQRAAEGLRGQHAERTACAIGDAAQLDHSGPRHGLRRDRARRSRVREWDSQGRTAPGSGGSMPSSGAGSTPGTSQSGTSMTGGASSEQVKSVQKALQDKGMDPGPLDGVMGPKTMAALKAFQKDQKLPESGKLDDQTREKLGVSR